MADPCATELSVSTPDGRTLEARVVGEGPLVVGLHGTPGSSLAQADLARAAVGLGLRFATFSRPGYGGSTRRTGRSVADGVPDVLAVADSLGADAFAVVGASGGGPHALACGALAPGRCRAVATIASAGPWDTPGLDFLAGMGEGNEVEFAAALRGAGPLTELLVPERDGIVEGGPEGTYTALESVLSPPDRAVFTGEVARRLHGAMTLGLRDGVDGWVDDDLAFVRPWGFAAADVSVPVFLWQGEQDLMVPPAHGRWLAAALPSCTARLLPDDGHLTLSITRGPQVLADLADALQ